MKSSVCALLLLGFATPALADELPTYDRHIENLAIERVQEKLPALRASIDVAQDLRLTVRDESKIAPMQRLIDMDKDKYRGHIFWL